MERKPINLADKFSRFSDHWSPKIIAQMNDYHFKLVKFEGEFVWHNHADTDEVSIVLEARCPFTFKTGTFQSAPEKCSSFRRGRSTKPGVACGRSQVRWQEAMSGTPGS